jgi:glycerophosphocholine phosphodiesterase GPCPD1
MLYIIALSIYYEFLFQGVLPITETILNDLSLIQKAQDLDLVLVCWGCENKDKTVLKTLKDNGINAVIFDKYDIDFI